MKVLFIASLFVSNVCLLAQTSPRWQGGTVSFPPGNSVPTGLVGGPLNQTVVLWNTPAPVRGANSHGGPGWERRVPDGDVNTFRRVSNLTGDFETLKGIHKAGKVVANNKLAYVLTGAQQKDTEKLVYDPYTIGLVLGYLYELQQFGPNGPPGGFTITKVFLRSVPPTAAGRRKKRSGAARRAHLVFTPKKKMSQQ